MEHPPLLGSTLYPAVFKSTIRVTGLASAAQSLRRSERIDPHKGTSAWNFLAARTHHLAGDLLSSAVRVELSQRSHPAVDLTKCVFEALRQPEN